MPVKLLMTWDIIPGREQEYFEFVVREFVPGIQRLGIQPTEAWYTTYGRRPQILTGAVADTVARMELALGTEEWRASARPAAGLRHRFHLEDCARQRRLSDVSR